MPIVSRCYRCGVIHEAPDDQAGHTTRCASCGAAFVLPSSSEAAAAPAALPVPRRPLWHWAAGLLLLLTCGILVMPLTSLLLSYLNSSRERQRQQTCREKISAIAAAMLDYEREYGALPPQSITGSDGRPWHSWRVLLLPYLDEKDLYKRYRFDEPWDGPRNRKLHDYALGVYHCPTDETPLTRSSYFVVSGPGTMFEPGKKIKSADATDGASGTALVVESAGQDVHWLDPRDLDAAALTPQINGGGQSISSKHPKLAHIGLVDQSERAVADDADPAAVRALLTRAGGETVPVPADARP